MLIVLCRLWATSVMKLANHSTQYTCKVVEMLTTQLTTFDSCMENATACTCICIAIII